MRTKNFLYAGVALGLFASMPLTPALAQDENSAGSADVGGPVIIVTARKREENLQDVPIAITAITDESLGDANAFGLEDVAELTPGLQFRLLGGVNEVTIRGLAQTDQTALQSNVGVFIDGIFLNNGASLGHWQCQPRPA